MRFPAKSTLNRLNEGFSGQAIHPVRPPEKNAQNVMPNNRIVDYGLLGLTIFALTSLVFWYFWPEILERLEPRPFPAQLAKVVGPLESGDTYTLQWQPAAAGPTPEFYYVERSTNPAFSSAPRYYVIHQAGKTPSKLFIAHAVAGVTCGKFSSASNAAA